jgi:hypothetical protein
MRPNTILNRAEKVSNMKATRWLVAKKNPVFPGVCFDFLQAFYFF